MLFEAKSKYLYVFLALLIVISVYGIRQYAVLVTDFIDKRNKKISGKTDGKELSKNNF